MSQISILMLFIVIVALFIAWAVHQSTKSKTRAEDDLAFNDIVRPKLIELYGVPTVLGGVTIMVLPPALEPTVNQYLNR